MISVFDSPLVMIWFCRNYFFNIHMYKNGMEKHSNVGHTWAAVTGASDMKAGLSQMIVISSISMYYYAIFIIVIYFFIIFSLKASL